jgi:hypothetical protein
MWFAEHGASKIGRITLDGTITEYDIPTPFAFPVGHRGRPRRGFVVHRVTRR